MLKVLHIRGSLFMFKIFSILKWYRYVIIVHKCNFCDQKLLFLIWAIITAKAAFQSCKKQFFKFLKNIYFDIKIFQISHLFTYSICKTQSKWGLVTLLPYKPIWGTCFIKYVAPHRHYKLRKFSAVIWSSIFVFFIIHDIACIFQSSSGISYSSWNCFIIIITCHHAASCYRQCLVTSHHAKYRITSHCRT